MGRWRLILVGAVLLAAASAAAVLVLMPGGGSTATPAATTSQSVPETNVRYCIEDTETGSPTTHEVFPGDETPQVGPCPTSWPPPP